MVGVRSNGWNKLSPKYTEFPREPRTHSRESAISEATAMVCARQDVQSKGTGIILHGRGNKIQRVVKMLIVVPGRELKHKQKDIDCGDPDIAILAERKRVYEAARASNPARWSGKTRNWDPITVAHLNRNKDEDVQALVVV